ncbi:hypothetical protein A0O34_00560 [Chryseobacterium glaciei]|uniref:CN hydrolase domain-containing protein n=1 Tax=Chryseobacterium glaciei TaxID=1685010 RepID=A0A172XQ76_9FLAO|nr:hypothetical protein [Chryseobacterium glaciei]ANF49138.1 hypothetical protein A0O34_00560 [Chryseobacterium glaciei]
MKISVAQTRPIKGDIYANIEIHKKLINLAVSHKTDSIFFSELSVTGYESEDKAMIHYPEIAKKFSMPVLMSNCVGFCDNFQSVGKSSVRSKQGNLVGRPKSNIDQ